MALAVFPDAQVKVLLADSEANHEGKIQDKDSFYKAIETTKGRVATKYPEVEASTFFEEAGGEEEFTQSLNHFYEALRSKIRLNHEDYEIYKDMGVDRRLSASLQHESSGTGGRLAGRGININPTILAERILRNSFAEMLEVGEMLRRKHSNLDGTCSAVVVFDQSTVTGLLNSGEKHATSLSNGTTPIPVILANSSSTV